MTIQNIALFQALGAKMDYLSQRQVIFAQNIANADTPGYTAHDLEEVDFSKVLRNVDKSSMKTVPVAATNSNHIGAQDSQRTVKAKDNRTPYEVSPSGNAVVMEEQLMNAGRNAMDYNLMANIYQKQVGLFKIALDKNG